MIFKQRRPVFDRLRQGLRECIAHTRGELTLRATMVPDESPLPRTLEPEVMDSPEEARDYDAMDHAAVNEAFAADVLTALAPTADLANLLDVGTGTARIPLALARRNAQLHITAVDLSESMLEIGQQHIDRAGLADHITLRQADCKQLPFASNQFNAVISNSLIHHIPEPSLALAEMLRVLRPDGVLFIRDLVRPASESDVDDLVARHAGGETPRQQALLRDSLHAALVLAEVQALLAEHGLPTGAARLTSDRHWTVRYRENA